MNQTIKSRIESVRNNITQAISKFARTENSVQLLAVSKTRTPDEITTAYNCGQTCFGESYLQEALQKIEHLKDVAIEWHFIGKIQSNKTRQIAENFDWVHSVDKLKHAQRLNDQRPDSMSPLNICLQINIDNEESKGGVDPEDAAELIQQVNQLPRIQLKGLMAIPSPTDDLDKQRVPFRKLRELRDRLTTDNMRLETLSMGMSGDIEAAIAEGSTIVRVGTAIFGPRNYKQKQ